MRSTHRRTRAPLLERLAELTVRRRGSVVGAWIALLVAVVALAPRFAGEFQADFATPDSGSANASRIVLEHFPGTSTDSVGVVWESRLGADSPRVRAQVESFLRDAAAVPGIGDPLPPRVSRDGTVALVTLPLERPFSQMPDGSGARLIELAGTANGDGVRIELSGGLIRNAEEGSSPEFAGLVAATVILLIAFGSVVAVGLPLLTAVVGLGISAMLIGVLAALIDVPGWAPAVAGLIGIGVGIDYALLILTRFRSALDDGADTQTATVEAVTTAGRSVLVAGGTVVISLFGLFFMGVSFLRGVAVSASLAVLVVMAASVTLVPAVLAFAGPRVERLRIPGLGRAQRTDGRTLATRWSRSIQRRPAAAASIAAVVLIALATPVLGLRFGFPDEGNDAPGSTTREAYELVQDAFGPGAAGPLVLVAEGVGERELESIRSELGSVEGVAFVSEPRRSPDGEASIMTVVPTTSPQSSETAELVHRLRDDALPRDVYVGGVTAAFVDQSDLMVSRLPVFVGGVVLLSFLLLLLAFRAPLIALKAGVMNVLSITAAYGVVALAAEGNAFGSLLGIESDMPVPPFMPVMMFAVLFGLSMDYEVFLLSRVREEYLRHGDTSRAVTDGLAKTARVITAAAAIMVAVFLAFVLSGEVFLALMGVGMAAAILVDATLVRMVLVPAAMQLLGRANWWTPGWLDRLLPQLDPEPTTNEGV